MPRGAIRAGAEVHGARRPVHYRDLAVLRARGGGGIRAAAPAPRSRATLSHVGLSGRAGALPPGRAVPARELSRLRATPVLARRGRDARGDSGVRPVAAVCRSVDAPSSERCLTTFRGRGTFTAP